MKLSAHHLASLKDVAVDAARQAGNLISEFAGKRVVQESKQAGDSAASQVVTEVDRLSENLIIDCLQSTIHEFDLGLLSEERGDDHSRLNKDYFWCIDPIDGTLSFIEDLPGYAVSIALVSRSGKPVIGVVFDPVARTLYSAVEGQGVMRDAKPWQLKSTGDNAKRPLTIPLDRSLLARTDNAHLLNQLEKLALETGYSGLKALYNGGAVMSGCWILDNAPGCYFKLPKKNTGGGSLWDFAAITCLFQEIGATATTFNGKTLCLNNPESTFMNRHGVFFGTDKRLAGMLHKLDYSDG